MFFQPFYECGLYETGEKWRKISFSKAVEFDCTVHVREMGEKTSWEKCDRHLKTQTKTNKIQMDRWEYF